MSCDILIGALLTEYKTLAAMMQIYCRDHHQSTREAGQTLCLECANLLSYAEMRLDRCPYGEQKPTCNQCPIHCYKPEPKQKMQQVMRYAGPRMLLPHPLLSLRHLLKQRKKALAKPSANLSNRARRKV